jgi:hypothetical protein
MLPEKQIEKIIEIIQKNFLRVILQLPSLFVQMLKEKCYSVKLAMR